MNIALNVEGVAEISVLTASAKWNDLCQKEMFYLFFFSVFFFFFAKQHSHVLKNNIHARAYLENAHDDDDIPIFIS